MYVKKRVRSVVQGVINACCEMDVFLPWRQFAVN
nr:MAG TPA: hypothetical protein [Caudoviricetes sp.]